MRVPKFGKVENANTFTVRLDSVSFDLLVSQRVIFLVTDLVPYLRTVLVFLILHKLEGPRLRKAEHQAYLCLFRASNQVLLMFLVKCNTILHIES